MQMLASADETPTEVGEALNAIGHSLIDEIDGMAAGRERIWDMAVEIKTGRATS